MTRGRFYESVQYVCRGFVGVLLKEPELVSLVFAHYARFSI